MDFKNQIKTTGGFDPEDVFSTAELAAKFDVNMCTVQRHLKELISEGKAEHAGQREDTKINGDKCQTPVYRIIEE